MIPWSGRENCILDENRIVLGRGEEGGDWKGGKKASEALFQSNGRVSGIP